MTAPIPPPPPATDVEGRRPWWKRWWGITAIVFVVLLAIGALTDDSDEEEGQAAELVEEPVEEPESEPDPVAVPNFVGMALDEARDLADDLGIELDEADTNRDRTIWAAENWTVETQDPAADTPVVPGMTVSVGVSNAVDDPEAPEPRDRDTDWLAEFQDSWGCVRQDWTECFDAYADPVGADLAGKVEAVADIELLGRSQFLVQMQTNNVDDGVWACTYIRNLWTVDNGAPSVLVFGASRELAKTSRLDGYECRPA